MLEADHPYITSDEQGIKDKNVASLFCMDKKESYIDMIRDMFDDRGQNCILKISLNVSNNEDVVF